MLCNFKMFKLSYICYTMQNKQKSLKFCSIPRDCDQFTVYEKEVKLHFWGQSQTLEPKYDLHN